MTDIITPDKKLCQICGKQHPEVNLVTARLVRPVVADIIKKSNPNWNSEGFICVDDLIKFRSKYVRAIVEAEKGELTNLENEVLNSISQHEILSTHVDKDFESQLTIGQRLSDKIAQFGGSWTFIILCGVVLLCWICVNSLALLAKPFDPYPYILMNLILSSLAAIQAPIIMMSQNRQEAKDRVRATHDYQINLKAELEIRQLHQKLDHLLSKQWERLVEIQEIQLELLNEMRGTRVSPCIEKDTLKREY
ncbi:MAG: DUF1003 domain-containing protein [Proteobacteria bacterium]|nr:DUF1003 domain-containing protein [Pseudomonadota bacterium]